MSNSPAIWLTVQLFGTRVGVDEFGNRYYRGRPLVGDRERRWVLYRGPAEGSAVPPLWQAWLTHTTDQPPSEGTPAPYPWQQPHRPNLTGTAEAHRPPGSLLGTTPPSPRPYQPWTPALDEETPSVPKRS
ncbi:MAG: NADH-ubiquinone oxidoreductase subunit NDUFA12 family protein [Rhodospirillales bacterium]|nr:NADH-ubiquinone oxidoreductase subunit NDUFA12 family protein [Rhodospirillales bacterium]